MSKEQLIEVTKDFPDFIELIERSRKIKSEANKLRRRLNTLKKKYSFLDHIMALNTKNDFFKKATIDLFIDLGCYVDKTDVGKEDFKIYFENRIILTEATGSNKATAKETKAFQITKHLNINRKKFPDKEVTCLSIFNYDNALPFSDRSKAVFNKSQFEKANSLHNKLITSIELIDLYCKVKKGEITLKYMIDELCTFE